MRSFVFVFLVGIHAVVACSVDHLVVAALDDASSAGHAGAHESAAGADNAGAAGDSGGAQNPAGNAGVDDSSSGAGGAPSLGVAGDSSVLITSMGGNVDVLIGGEAGAASKFICSCLSNQAQLCGTDGITYDGITCEDGGACSPLGIACWHACPCNPGDSPDLNSSTTWFSPDCAATVQCSGDFTCMAFAGDATVTCGTTGN